jgi:hypothetical protein
MLHTIRAPHRHRTLRYRPQPSLNPGISQRLHQNQRASQANRHHHMMRTRPLIQPQQRHHTRHNTRSQHATKTLCEDNTVTIISVHQ